MVAKICAYLSIIALVFIVACNQVDVTAPNGTNHKEPLKVIVAKDEYQKAEMLRKNGEGSSDPFTIEKVEVAKDSLVITVSYYGAVSGMGEPFTHKFTLYWSGEVSIMTYPMIANLILTHDANGDPGSKTKYIKTLIFSLKDLGITNSKDYTFRVFSMLNKTDVPDDSTTNSGTSGQ